MSYADECMEEIFVILKEFESVKKPWFSATAVQILVSVLTDIGKIVNKYRIHKQHIVNAKDRLIFSGDIYTYNSSNGTLINVNREDNVD